MHSSWHFATACRQHAPIFFPFLFIFSHPFVTYSLAHCFQFYCTFYLLANTTRRLTWWVMNSVEVTLPWQPTTMNVWDGDGTKVRGKACESGWCVCDSRRKVPTVGHLGGKRAWLLPWLPPRWPTSLTSLSPRWLWFKHKRSIIK